MEKFTVATLSMFTVLIR